MNPDKANDDLKEEIIEYQKNKAEYIQQKKDGMLPFAKLTLNINILHNLVAISLKASHEENAAWILDNAINYNNEIDFLNEQIENLYKNELIPEEVRENLNYLSMFRLPCQTEGCDLILTDKKPLQTAMNQDLPFQIGHGYIRVKNSITSELLEGDTRKMPFVLKPHDDKKLDEFDELVNIKQLEKIIEIDSKKDDKDDKESSSSYPKKYYPKQGSYPIGRVLSISEVYNLQSKKIFSKLTGYDFRLMSDDTKPIKGKIYIKEKENCLEYTVLNSHEEVINGKINKEELRQDISKISQIDQLKPSFQEILKITSKRGHTQLNTPEPPAPPGMLDRCMSNFSLFVNRIKSSCNIL